MKKSIVMFALTIVLTMAAASPALAATGADFGAHHAEHARDMGGFSAEMNPGMHQGFSGWMCM